MSKSKLKRKQLHSKISKSSGSGNKRVLEHKPKNKESNQEIKKKQKKKWTKKPKPETSGDESSDFEEVQEQQQASREHVSANNIIIYVNNVLIGTSYLK